MDVLTTLRVCAKRWYVFIPILVLGAVGTLAYASSQKSTWSVTQHLLVVPPSTSTTVKPGQTTKVNPFGGGPNAARLAASGMASSLQSKTTEDQLSRVGPTASYAVKTDKSQALVDVIVVGPVRADVEARVQGLTFLSKIELAGVQQRAGSPADRMLQVVPSIPGVPVAAEVPPTRTKGVVALSLLTLLLAAVGSIVAERLSTRRDDRSTFAYPGERRVTDADGAEQPVAEGSVHASEPAGVSG